MNNNYSDEELDNMLGTKPMVFEKFRTISIDNGEDLAGTNATGDFVEKKFNEETKRTERETFAQIFQGVILSSQAQLIDKSKVPTWMTGEFETSRKDTPVKIYPLADGKFMKDENNKVKVSFSTYDKIKAARRLKQPDGTYVSTYNYFIVLYVGVFKEEGNEIIKLKFKGTGRGNFFNYSKSLNYMRAKLYNVATEFSTYKDRSTGKYAISFACVKDGNNPISVDDEEVRMMRIRVVNNLIPSNKTLAGPAQNKQISTPEKKEEMYPEEHIPAINEEDGEVNLKIEDVPFD